MLHICYIGKVLLQPIVPEVLNLLSGLVARISLAPLPRLILYNIFLSPGSAEVSVGIEFIHENFASVLSKIISAPESNKHYPL